jgi:hypothetical protein
MDGRVADFRDPEYGAKVGRLKERLAENPPGPRVVVLGSSRVSLGFRPDVVKAWPGSQKRPFVFNFGLLGAGPVQELYNLRRLLNAGIHPDCLVLEILPTHLHQWPPWREENWLGPSRLSWKDLRVVRRYWAETENLYRQWGKCRLLPCFWYRFCIMGRLAPTWLPPSLLPIRWRQALDPLGWTPCTLPIDPPTRNRYLEALHKQYLPAFQDFQISDLADRALHELLDLCRRKHLPVLLLIMPESSEFRSWYSPEACKQIDAYVAALRREYGLQLIDARTWIEDHGFVDGHHLLIAHATVFSERLAREVMTLEPSTGQQ